MSPTTTQPQPLPVGCIFDGARGDSEISQLVQRLAISEGWQGPAAADDDEFLDEAVAEAVEYLEQNCTPDGARISFANGGDFGCWQIRYKPEQVRYFIHAERGEYTASFYHIDPETGADEAEPFCTIDTAEAQFLTAEGVSTTDPEEIVNYYASLRGEDAPEYAYLDSDDEPEEEEQY